VSSVVMTSKVKNRERTAGNFKATGWTVWCKVPGTTAEDSLHPSNTKGIIGRLESNINLNYI